MSVYREKAHDVLKVVVRREGVVTDLGVMRWCAWYWERCRGVVVLGDGVTVVRSGLLCWVRRGKGTCGCDCGVV